MYHSIRFKVDKVEITDYTAMSWLVPSKEDSSLVVNTCQCEICTGRRSSPCDRRGEPDTCRRLYTNVCTHSMNSTMTTLAEVKNMDLTGPSPPINEPGAPDE